MICACRWIAVPSGHKPSPSGHWEGTFWASETSDHKNPSTDQRMEIAFVKEYKFSVGQSVYLRVGRLLGATAGSYQVTQRMPERDGELQYRVKHQAEGHERAASENDLTAI
jgi:hypothetical protein